MLMICFHVHVLVYMCLMFCAVWLCLVLDAFDAFVYSRHTMPTSRLHGASGPGVCLPQPPQRRRKHRRKVVAVAGLVAPRSQPLLLQRLQRAIALHD